MIVLPYISVVILVLILLILYLWVGGLVVEVTDEDPHFVLLWPLVIVKATIKGLFKLLFTGWRD